MTPLPVFADTETAVRELRPDIPLHCLRPHIAQSQTERFAAGFPGDVLYATKANPDKRFLLAALAGGAAGFDVASIGEIEHVHAIVPRETKLLSNPVKPRRTIARAYHDFGVRDFTLDSAAEYQKIREETSGATDLSLLVRIAVPPSGARWAMSEKFGAGEATAVALLRDVRRTALRVGVCFHVGSLCTNPIAWTKAIAEADRICRLAGIRPDILNVGGGFAVDYLNLIAPSVEDYLAAIFDGLASVDLAPDSTLICEIGRAIAAPAASLVVRVIARDGGRLYLNDGLYGGLAAPGPPPPELGLPLRVLPMHGRNGRMRDYIAFGPTCDGSDQISGLLRLPEDIREGDWLEFGQHGAYGAALRTDFNTLAANLSAITLDSPDLSSWAAVSELFPAPFDEVEFIRQKEIA